MAYCANCGTKIDEEARFCGECGTPVVHASIALPAQTPSVSATASPSIATPESAPEPGANSELNAKYAVDAAVNVASSAVAAAASVTATGAAIVNEIGKRTMSSVNAANPATKKKVIGTLVLVALLGGIGFSAKTLFFALSPKSPESTIKEFYTTLEQGDVEAMVKLFVPSKTNLANEKEKIASVVLSSAADIKSKGGLSQINTKCIQDEDNENEQSCKVTIKFGDGDEEGPTKHLLRKINGVWKIK
ncbi:zinc ribbon domain-containing protein [Deefgea rivuli]|uniref:zinc ribbon domain-containing protein n=1 Tax=Deefgea rivuli TaxID=400948 RepID=UPI000480B11D|nr:zinc-ribbon domain-containing protein [Deefgea rivuli]